MNGVLFTSGVITTSVGAVDALEDAEQEVEEFVRRHVDGDWGIVSEFDRQCNEDAMKAGGPVFSSYQLATGIVIWVCTDDQRKGTRISLVGGI